MRLFGLVSVWFFWWHGCFSFGAFGFLFGLSLRGGCLVF